MGRLGRGGGGLLQLSPHRSLLNHQIQLSFLSELINQVLEGVVAWVRTDQLSRAEEAAEDGVWAGQLPRIAAGLLRTQIPGLVLTPPAIHAALSCSPAGIAVNR